MAHSERRAEVNWEGGLARGKGTVTGRSGAFGTLPITWASRTERSDGKTSPEELIAAAHAGCYAMALSHTIESAGKTPKNLHVSAVCTLDQVGSGFKITKMQLEVRGNIPETSSEEFKELATKAEQGCPVSNALRNNLEIVLNAELDS